MTTTDVTFGKYLNPFRTNKIPKGIKAKRNYEVINHNPESVKPGATLYVKIPKLEEGQVIVPKSMKLTFKLETTSKASDDSDASAAEFVANVGRNIVERITVKLGGRTMSELDKAYIYKTFKDFWLTEEQRKNRVMQGIDKTQRQGTSKKDSLVTAFGDRYCIPIESEIFDDFLPFYPSAILESIEYNIKFNEAKYVVSGTSTSKTYSVSDIQLEYETIYSPELSNTIEAMYSEQRFLYEDVHLLKTEATGTNKRININVDVNRASTKGILLFFQKSFTEYDAEKTSFKNPDITNVTITSEGISHCIYKSGMKPYNQFNEVKKHFMSEEQKKYDNCMMNVEKYFGSDKFALWVDLRSTEDNEIHGTGTAMSNIKHGLQLELSRSTETEYDMMVYIVADGLLGIDNKKVSGIVH